MSWKILIKYKKHILHDVIMIVKEYQIYLFHNKYMILLYTFIEQEMLSVFTNQVLYFSKYVVQTSYKGNLGYFTYLSVFIEIW